jgi:hypothetical protein
MMTTAEKRSLTQSINKAKESFVKESQTYREKSALYEAFYDYWIIASKKLAWQKDRTLDDNFKSSQMERIEALLADCVDVLVEKTKTSIKKPSKKMLRR